MIIRLKLTDEHLKLIPAFFIQEPDENTIVINKDWLFGGTHLLEDLSYILGVDPIKGTEEDSDGKAFSDEDTNHMLEVFNYVKDNLYYIESLIHQCASKGGITSGEYKCKDNEVIWKRSSDN